MLKKIGVDFCPFDPDIDESQFSSELPLEYVQRVARSKALTGQRENPGRLILAADTVVSLGEKILGKPRNQRETIRALEELSGKQHKVMTSVVVIDESEKERISTVTTYVLFRDLDSATIRAYASSGECVDKAGGYAIQGLGSVLVRGVRGSLSNVVGLPLKETIKLLNLVKIPNLFSSVTLSS